MASQGKLEKLRAAGRILAVCRRELAGMVRPGVTGLDLDRRAEEIITGLGGRPAFKGYRGYPAAICVSPNQVVIHGIPNAVPFREGDLVSLDLGVEKDGFYADGAITCPVGEAAPEYRRLLETTRRALELAIDRVAPGVEIDELGRAIEGEARSHGFDVVRSFCGHGIGRQLHQPPEIPNFASGNRFRLYAGLALAIEPMVNYKSGSVVILDDGWTVMTADGGCSAHFEETVLVTETGHEVVTRL